MPGMESITEMILCTGNPDHVTVASAVSRKFPQAQFASRATGYDLRFWDPGSEDHFKNQIKNFDVFINSSFICGGGQLALLETTFDVWSSNCIQGHITNIGSTAEFIGTSDHRVAEGVYGKYSIQKRALRDRSLQLNNQHGIKTTHIIAGGLNDGHVGHESWLDLNILADTIAWILDHPADIPLLSMQSKAVDQ